VALPLIIAGAIALLALAALRFSSACSRRAVTPPVTEADARAHARPLTKSVLSVGHSPGDRARRDA
jgi:hypothetical protein